MTEHAAHGVERARGVEPVAVSDEPLVTEHQLLPSSAEREATLVDIADIHMRDAEVELIAEWGAECDGVASFDARVLRLNGGAQPGFHRKPCRQTKSIQPVEILTIVSEAAACKSLESSAILDSQAHPRRQIDVCKCRRGLLR